MNSTPAAFPAESVENGVTITLDGQVRHVTAGNTLADLVQEVGHTPQAVATSVNGNFVPRGARHVSLKSGDAVLFFQPITGG